MSGLWWCLILNHKFDDNDDGDDKHVSRGNYLCACWDDGFLKAYLNLINR